MKKRLRVCVCVSHFSAYGLVNLPKFIVDEGAQSLVPLKGAEGHVLSGTNMKVSIGRWYLRYPIFGPRSLRVGVMPVQRTVADI